jgi:hypothetical protein
MVNIESGTEWSTLKEGKKIINSKHFSLEKLKCITIGKFQENQEGLKPNGTYHFLICVPGINWAKARVVRGKHNGFVSYSLGHWRRNK